MDLDLEGSIQYGSGPKFQYGSRWVNKIRIRTDLDPYYKHGSGSISQIWIHITNPDPYHKYKFESVFKIWIWIWKGQFNMDPDPYNKYGSGLWMPIQITNADLDYKCRSKRVHWIQIWMDPYYKYKSGSVLQIWIRKGQWNKDPVRYGSATLIQIYLPMYWYRTCLTFFCIFEAKNQRFFEKKS